MCLRFGSDLGLAVTKLVQCLAVAVAFGSVLSLAVTQLGQCLAAVVVAISSVSSLAVTHLGQCLAAAWLHVAGTIKVVVDSEVVTSNSKIHKLNYTVQNPQKLVAVAGTCTGSFGSR